MNYLIWVNGELTKLKKVRNKMFKKNERIFEVANLMMPMMITLAIRLGMTPREFFEEVNDYTTLNKFMETLNELAKEKMERKMNGNK